jgi:hypothetical protein
VPERVRVGVCAFMYGSVVWGCGVGVVCTYVCCGCDVGGSGSGTACAHVIGGEGKSAVQASSAPNAH